MINKFKKGDKVTFIEYDYYPETCYICNGKKKVLLKKEHFKCPKCEGKGYIEQHKKWQVNKEYGLSKIERFDTINGHIYAVFSKVAYTDIIEGTHYAHRYIPIEDCFFKESSAKIVCSIRNNKHE